MLLCDGQTDHWIVEQDAALKNNALKGNARGEIRGTSILAADEDRRRITRSRSSSFSHRDEKSRSVWAASAFSSVLPAKTTMPCERGPTKDEKGHKGGSKQRRPRGENTSGARTVVRRKGPQKDRLETGCEVCKKKRRNNWYWGKIESHERKRKRKKKRNAKYISEHRK